VQDWLRTPTWDFGRLVCAVSRHAESVEYRTLVAVGAMILVSCLSTLISFRILSAKLEAMNAAANDGNLRGGAHDAGDEGTEGHFGSKELRVLRHFVDEPSRSGGSVGHTRATRQGSAGAVLQRVRASSKGGAQAPGRPGHTPPADKPVDVAARSPSHHKSRESAKRPDAATPRSGKVQKESRDSFKRRMPGTSDSSAKRPDAATPRSGKVQKESRDSFKRRMPGTSDSNGTGGLSDAVRPRSPSDPLPPFHTILRASLTKRALSQPVERPEAEEMRLQELRKVAQRGDSLDGMVSARAGSAVRAHSEHDRGFQEPIGPKRSASDEKSASDEGTLLSAVANSRGTSPRRVESASGKSPRRRGAPDEKILLPAENSRGASPRRGSASPQRSFSELLNASSGSLFYASIVDEKLRSKHAETTYSTQAEQVQANSDFWMESGRS
jgi:hypothetical protein